MDEVSNEIGIEMNNENLANKFLDSERNNRVIKERF